MATDRFLPRWEVGDVRGAVVAVDATRVDAFEFAMEVRRVAGELHLHAVRP